MTPRTICTLALKLSGALAVGQTALAEDINDAFTMLNMMLGQWSQKRWLVYHLIDVVAPASSTGIYTIGTNGQINTPRPDRIASAFARYGSASQPVDYPLEIIEARKDWNRIGLKGMTGSPSAVFYDSGYPLGTVYVYPVPLSQYVIHLSLKQPLAAFGNLSDDLNVPDEYQEALLYNLAVRLCAVYGLAVRSDVVAIAKAALNTIRNSNTQIANLRMPAGLPGRRNWGGGGGLSWGAGLPGGIIPPIIVPPDPTTDPSSSVLGIGVLGLMILQRGGATGQDFGFGDFSPEFSVGYSPNI